MNRLTYPLAALLIGIAASTSAIASPQDAHARAVSASQTFGRDSFDTSAAGSARLVRAGYSPVQGDASGNVATRTAFAANTPSITHENTANDDVPQNKALTLLAGIAVIVVIAKRRLSARKF